MMTLTVPDMSCAHCSSVITKALRALDTGAVIDFDLPNHRVQVDTTRTVDAVLEAMNAAGYPATAA